MVWRKITSMISNGCVYMKICGRMETLKWKQLEWQLAWLLTPLAKSLTATQTHKHTHKGLKSHISGQSTSRDFAFVDSCLEKPRLCVNNPVECVWNEPGQGEASWMKALVRLWSGSQHSWTDPVSCRHIIITIFIFYSNITKSYCKSI